MRARDAVFHEVTGWTTLCGVHVQTNSAGQQRGAKGDTTARRGGLRGGSLGPGSLRARLGQGGLKHARANRCMC